MMRFLSLTKAQQGTKVSFCHPRAAHLFRLLIDIFYFTELTPDWRKDKPRSDVVLQQNNP